LTSAREQQIRAIYRAALERLVAERAAFVAQLAGGDQELRRAVELMLAQQVPTDAAGRRAMETDDTAELAAGTRIGSYRIDGVLGRGGMGIVYRATDTKLDRPVAIKFVSIATADAHAQRRFRQEAHTASGLHHPHIVTVHDVGESDGRQYIVSELVDGGTLDDWLASSRRRTWRQSVELLTGVADAIAAAHAAGVLHRDIKPANILIDENGYAKLADFGLAKLLGDKDGQADALGNVSRNTRAGIVVGTVAYMSPEQASGQPLDARSDIFSFGVVLYELLAGRRPFEGANDLEVLKAIVHGTPPPLPSDVPELLRNAVERALEKDPGDRYQAMRELVIELKRIARKSGSSSQTALPNAAPRRARLARLLAGLAAVAVLVAAALYYPRAPVTDSASGSAALARDYEIARLTASGNAILPALSPDGRYVAYVQEHTDGPSLWVRQLATESHVRLVQAEPGVGFRAVTVTRDGNFVDFVQRSGIGEPWLWRVPFLPGAAPRLLVEDVWSPVGWSPDGTQMAFVRDDFGSNSSAIIVADADGGNERVLATRRPPVSQFLSLAFGGIGTAPAWSPDGRTLAVFARDGSTAEVRVVFLDAVTGAEVTALGSGGAFPPRGIDWLDPTTLLVSQPAPDGGPVQLWRLSYPEGVVSRITNDLNSYVGISLDASRNRLATSQSETRSTLWVGDGNGSNGADLLAPTPTLGTAVAWAGARVLHTNLANGRPSVVALAAGGGVSVDIVSNGDDAAATSDGATIVFRRGSDGGIWKANVDGREARQLVSGIALSPVVSRDGRHVFFISLANGQQAPWVVPMDGGEPAQVADEFAGVGSLDVSPDDGRLLFFSSDTQGRRMFVICDWPCTDRRELAVPTNLLPRHQRWIPGGRAIAYIDTGSRNIWALPLDGRTPQQLTRFTDGDVQSFAWSRDGTRLAVIRSTTTNDIVLLQGLRE
jgi:Tol biopolymer transport system component